MNQLHRQGQISGKGTHPILAEASDPKQEKTLQQMPSDFICTVSFPESPACQLTLQILVLTASIIIGDNFSPKEKKNSLSIHTHILLVLVSLKMLTNTSMEVEHESLMESQSSTFPATKFMGKSHTAFASSKKTVCGPMQSIHPAQGSLSDLGASPSSLNIVPYRPATKKLEDKLPPCPCPNPAGNISTETRSLS